MYLESHGENIEDDLLECWKILRKSPKWDQHCEDKAREAEAKKRSTALFRRSVPLLKTVHGQFLKFLYKT